MPAQKQKAPATPERAGRRRSGRISASGGGKKSQYFEGDTDDDADELAASSDSDTRTVSGSKKRGRGRPPTKKTTPRSMKKAKVVDEDIDDYGEGELDDTSGAYNNEDDDDDDELGEDEEPRVTITPLIKMRETGGVPYEDERLHKNTMLFLKDLKANNKRSWLKSNDAEYRRSLTDWNTFVETLTSKIIIADPTIPELPIKDVVFRIYRDIRFSKDPTPYKPHYSAAFSRTGRKGPYACYYVHCDPGSCFVGGGLWMPDAAHLAKLRRSIDERPGRWRRVLGDEAFRSVFVPGAKRGDEEACVKEFAKRNKENALKTKPKGFDADHRDIELLKLRNFTVGTKIPDSVFTAERGQEQIVTIVRAMVGFITFLNNIVMPDINLDSDSSSDDDEDEE